MDETVRVFGRVDVLVNAVGAFAWKPVADTAPEEWRALMASNLDSVYHMSRLVLPSMRQNHWGRIVNLGAVGAERTDAQPKVAAYSAAKAAVVAFSKALALEEARCGHHRQRGLARRAGGRRRRAAPAPRTRTPRTASRWDARAARKTSCAPSSSSAPPPPTS